MKTPIAFRTVIAALSVMFFTAAASEALAACGSSQRMSHRDSRCLEASWDNNYWPHTTTYEVRSVCDRWGKVVAKIDLKSAADHTLHLNNSDWRRAEGSFRVRWIYCCKDISDLCNTSEMKTNESCRDGFEDRDEVDDCTLDDGTSGARIRGDHCVYNASCLDDASQPNQTSLSIHRADLEFLKNCNGVLKRDSC